MRAKRRMKKCHRSHAFKMRAGERGYSFTQQICSHMRTPQNELKDFLVHVVERNRGRTGEMYCGTAEVIASQAHGGCDFGG